AVIGVGMIKFGELFDKSLENMVQEAYLNCLNDVQKGIDPKEIKAAWFGQWSGGFIGQGAQSGQSLASMIGNLEIPVTRIENACPTGGDTFRHACLGVASGVYDVVLALGAEKMRDKTSAESLGGAGGGGGSETGNHPSWMMGQGGPSIQALHATRQIHQLGYTMADFARVAVKNHHNGTLCPYAHYRFEVTLERVLGSYVVCWPLHLLDCCPQTDGAAAAIVCRADLAHKYTDKPIHVLATNVGVDHVNLWDRESFVEQLSTVRAAKGAFEMAGIKPADVDFAEVHDCFTIAEVLATEDLGFFKPGEGPKAAEEGKTARDGEKPINTSGGLKAKGHPVGATGVGQLVEVWEQMSGHAGPRQVPGANLTLTHNVGASGSTVTVHIFERR
ncbi:MAG: thiolase domain-containing protein, partial [Deltaproteobacteria bacterium]|nr:thiolase domain-containing protein [Deltaproteobacteria bacterium]